MLLVSPSEAAIAIGARCGGSAPSDSDPQLLSVLRMITPRVEEALGVKSLTRGTHSEVFYLNAMPSLSSSLTAPRRVSMLRTDNGFLMEDDSPAYELSVLDPDGVAVDISDKTLIRTDLEYGIVRLFSWVRGEYTITYQSGFSPESLPIDSDPENALLLGIPDWLKAIAIGYLIVWFRIMNKMPAAPDKISYKSMMEALRGEIYSRIYSRYQRPRYDCIFGDAA